MQKANENRLAKITMPVNTKAVLYVQKLWVRIRWRVREDEKGRKKSRNGIIPVSKNLKKEIKPNEAKYAEVPSRLYNFQVRDRWVSFTKQYIVEQTVFAEWRSPSRLPMRTWSLRRPHYHWSRRQKDQHSYSDCQYKR